MLAVTEQLARAGRGVVDLAVSHGPWMQWNLILAVIPLALAWVLFGVERERTVRWWCGVAAFLVFLPNAPYVLTDAIHLLGDIRATRSDLFVVGAIVPLYTAFFLVGMGCYVAALNRAIAEFAVGDGTRRRLELASHAVCAVGIFLGRVLRFNSWQVVTHPVQILRAIPEALRPSGIAFITLTFAALVVATALVRALVHRAEERIRKFV